MKNIEEIQSNTNNSQEAKKYYKTRWIYRLGLEIVIPPSML